MRADALDAVLGGAACLALLVAAPLTAACLAPAGAASGATVPLIGTVAAVALLSQRPAARVAASADPTVTVAILVLVGVASLTALHVLDCHLGSSWPAVTGAVVREPWCPCFAAIATAFLGRAAVSAWRGADAR